MMERQIDKRAGFPAREKDLVKKDKMEADYYHPDKSSSLIPIKNGTSGHRGKTGVAITDLHIAAMTQALADLRRELGTFGPKLPSSHKHFYEGKLGAVIAGKDVRFTSDFALITSAEVFSGNSMQVIIQSGDRATPTPVVSRTILQKNEQGKHVEGVIITASHNPPEEAGYKSNGLNGGPNTLTAPIDERANYYLQHPEKIKRLSFKKAIEKKLVIKEDFLEPYINDLKEVIDFTVLARVPFAATPLGGSAGGYYEAVNEKYGTKITEVLGEADPAGSHRTYDWDGKLRGDPSSSYVMKAVKGYRDKLGVPFIGANDNDADRFGGEDATAGILNPNHVLCVVFEYFTKFRNWKPSMGIGRTIGTTHMLDLIAAKARRPVYEVNVGFKYYVDGLLTGKYVLAGEESGGMCFPRKNGLTWVTEKDGIAAVLILMEIISRTGKDFGTLYHELEERYGKHLYERIDTPATPEKKTKLLQLAADPKQVENALQGKKIANRKIERLVIGDGIKVVLEGGVWVLKRPSGTENIIKDYREERGTELSTARRASEEIDHYLSLT